MVAKGIVVMGFLLQIILLIGNINAKPTGPLQQVVTEASDITAAEQDLFLQNDTTDVDATKDETGHTAVVKPLKVPKNQL